MRYSRKNGCISAYIDDFAPKNEDNDFYRKLRSLLFKLNFKNQTASSRFLTKSNGLIENFTVVFAYVLPYYLDNNGENMTTLTVSEARTRLYRLIDEVAESHQPAFIKGKRSNGILISEEDWNSIQETMFLLSIPNMRESIKEGMDTPIENCSEDLDW